jgi:hypothetical protein
MKDPTYENVARLVAKSVGVPFEKITPGSDIESDLHTTGDDADELVEQFAQEFGVDISGMDFYRHFSPEVWIPFHASLFRRRRGYEMCSVPVTVQMLVDAARASRWPSFD